jgi:hypothetical protein
MQSGISALSWASGGYSLLIAETAVDQQLDSGLSAKPAARSDVDPPSTSADSEEGHEANTLQPSEVCDPVYTWICNVRTYVCKGFSNNSSI